MLSKDEIRDIIVKRSRDEQNGKLPEDFNHYYEMTNPMCGDHVKVYLLIREGKVLDLRYKSSGCTLCMASSSFMRDEVSSLNTNDVLEKVQMLEKHLNSRETDQWPDELMNLRYFEHLKKNPTRRMCVFLPWASLKRALNFTEARVSR